MAEEKESDELTRSLNKRQGEAGKEWVKRDCQGGERKRKGIIMQTFK